MRAFEEQVVTAAKRALAWVWQRKGTRVVNGPELSGTPLGLRLAGWARKGKQ